VTEGPLARGNCWFSAVWVPPSLGCWRAPDTTSPEYEANHVHRKLQRAPSHGSSFRPSLRIGWCCRHGAAVSLRRVTRSFASGTTGPTGD